MMNKAKTETFNHVPQIKRPRNLFSTPFSVKTTFDAGKLVPLKVIEVNPGDGIGSSYGQVLRALTPKFPMLDDAFLDVYTFFVPNRLTWDHWEQFLGGAADPSDYTSPAEYNVPQINFSTVNANATYQTDVAGKLWDYLGVGAGSKDTKRSSLRPVSALYPRGYVKIWNDWFRDENLQQYAHMYRDDTDRSYPTYTSSQDPSINPLVDAELGYSLLPVNKFHDYFTSALRQPQKHPPIILPLGETAPVVSNNAKLPTVSFANDASTWIRVNGNASSPAYSRQANVFDAQSTPRNLLGRTGGTGVDNDTVPGTSQTTLYQKLYFDPSQIHADLSEATGITVNEFRLFFQTQRFYEQLARCGSRYQEFLQGMFGVYANDARLQRVEFLSARRYPIRQHQVQQTAVDNEGDGLGETGAFSFTSGSGKLIREKGFTEHGLLYILCCVRTSLSYSQGVSRSLTRREKFDYFFPVFQHIGEQPIYTYELYNDGYSAATSPSIFGYKEAWSEYRTEQSVLTGQMRPYVDNNFAQWHYSEVFSNAPTLSSTFIEQGKAVVDRSLEIQSSVVNQFFGDFAFGMYKKRVMSLYGTPGLVDHD